MRAVIEHYQGCGATDPAFVVFQTDGEPSDRPAIKQLLQQSSTLPIFWQFVGFGGTRLKFLRTLDTLKGRTSPTPGSSRRASTRASAPTPSCTTA